MPRFLLPAILLTSLLFLTTCTAPTPTTPLPPNTTRRITIDANHPAANLYSFWDVTNFNHPHSLLDPHALETLIRPTPFLHQVNCVYLLGGRWPGQNNWVLAINPDRSLKTDFTQMIAQLKIITNAGLSPRIVLDDVPEILSDPPQQNTYGNTAPPADEHLWHAYVKAAITAIVQAYGEKTASAWTYRVGTEPDLFPAHWTGTRQQYFAHYDFTVDAVRSVLPHARIGPGNILNPASPPPTTAAATRPNTLKSHWGLDIIDHAATGINACTGKIGTPIDVFSCSWYAKVGRSTSNFDQAVANMRTRLDKYPQFKNTPIEIGEFSVLNDEHNKHLYAGETTEWSASFYASLADRAYKLHIPQIYQWDYATGGIMMPQGRVIEMLEQMKGNPKLPVTTLAATDSECSALAVRQKNDLLILIYNHHPDRAPKPDETVQLVIDDDRMHSGSAWFLNEWTIDHDHAVWAYAFEADATAAGVSPLKVAGLYEASSSRLYGDSGPKIFKQNAAKYAALSIVPRTRTNTPLTANNHTVSLQLTLPTHSVRLLRLSQKQTP